MRAIIVLMMGVAMSGVGCSHAQKPRSQVYVISEDSQGVTAGLGTGGSGERDCQAEHEECFRKCWENRRPKYPHKHDEWYYKRCTTDCREAFNQCEDEKEKEARSTVKRLEFSRIDQALEWLRAHKTEVALGTVVIVAGVAFVVATGGTGALLLVPLAL
jgi:hypothetical protein